LVQRVELGLVLPLVDMVVVQEALGVQHLLLLRMGLTVVAEVER
jgi:hypothetical protein